MGSIGVTVEKTNPKTTDRSSDSSLRKKMDRVAVVRVRLTPVVPRKFDDDSCRVKAGETRYPPADGRHEGHQKVAR